MRLRLVGFQPAGAGPETRKALGQLADDGFDVMHTEWVPHGDPYLVEVAKFDIWVAPYHATPFNEAKFATKALEAGFWGIPLIASDIRPYREWGGDGLDLVDEYRTHGWSRSLRNLIEDSDWRRHRGEAARSQAARYSMQEVGRQWEGAILG